MHRHLPIVGACALAVILSLASGAGAQLAVSANDGKAVLVDGATRCRPTRPPDSVALIDLSATPPKVVAELAVPASVVGPPSSVAIARDESFALVTAATKLDPADPKKVVPDDRLTVIDLKSSPPKVLAQLQAGRGAAGVSINRAGNAGARRQPRGRNGVGVLHRRQRAHAGRQGRSRQRQVGSEPRGLCAGRQDRAGHAATATTRFRCCRSTAPKSSTPSATCRPGLRPYGLDIHPNGKVAVVANIGTGGGDADTVSLIDLEAKPPRVVHTLTVGQTPEGITLSPDGAYAAVSVMNGSNKAKARRSSTITAW